MCLVRKKPPITSKLKGNPPQAFTISLDRSKKSIVMILALPNAWDIKSYIPCSSLNDVMSTFPSSFTWSSKICQFRQITSTLLFQWLLVSLKQEVAKTSRFFVLPTSSTTTRSFLDVMQTSNIQGPCYSYIHPCEVFCHTNHIGVVFKHH